MPIRPRPVTSDAASTDDLAHAARDGDLAALGALYDRSAPSLYRTLLRYTDSTADAEDVLHDVFVGLPEALRAYAERGRFDAWLARVAVRHAMMRRRAQSRRREEGLDGAAPLAAADDAARRTDDASEHAGLHAAVRALPDPLRHVLLLRQVEGFSHDEIASVLGISTGNSRARLSRAIDALRRTLGTATTSPRTFR